MDKYVGWLTPASEITDDMKIFEARLKKNFKDTAISVHFPNHQYLAGDNSKLDDCTQSLLDNDPKLDLIVVGGSSGVRAVARAQAARGSTIPIIQVVGGEPTPEGSPLITGYHINDAKIAAEQVKKLHNNYCVNRITVLIEYSSETSARSFNAIERAASELGITLKPLFARNPTELQELSRGDNPLDTSFMLTASGMFFNPANMGCIISLVEDANVYAIYPEREYKLSHKPSYRPRVIVHGHHITQTYCDAADLVSQIIDLAPPFGTALPAGGEASTDDWTA